MIYSLEEGHTSLIGNSFTSPKYSVDASLKKYRKINDLSNKQFIH